MTDDWFNYSDPYSPTTAGYWLDHHPRTYDQWKRQQWIQNNIPILGQVYGAYLRNKSQSEFIEATMQSSGLEWSDIKNPYHSSMLLGNSTTPNYVGAAASVSSNIRRLYR